MNKFIKPPSLSTGFSESGKSAKKRFNNILNTKAKKTGVLAFVLILLLVGIVGTMIACNNTNNSSAPESNIKRLYELKDTYVGDNSKVYDIVHSVNFSDISIRSIELKTDSKPYGIRINYKVDSRANYRFFDDSSFDKSAAVIFSLIPNADEIRFIIYDNYSNADNPDSSFGGGYYNRQNLTERRGMEYFTDDNVRNAASSIEAFNDYWNKVVSSVSSRTFYKNNVRFTQIYHVIGDDCEIMINSQLQVFITVTKEIAVNPDLRALLEPKNIKLSEQIGKKLEFSTLSIRNFKTDECTDYLFVFDGENLVTYEDLKAPYKDREVMDVLRTFADGGN